MPAASLFAMLLIAQTTGVEAPADAVEIAQSLDVTSFPNSIGPRREVGRETFADYGFTKVQLDGKTAELRRADDSWVFRIRVLEMTGDRAELCVLDRALDGGSYFTVKPVEVAKGKDGRYRATGRAVESLACV